MRKILFVLLFILFFLPTFSFGQGVEGFLYYELKAGDTYWKIATTYYPDRTDEIIDIMERVNRIDRYHLKAGNTILIPNPDNLDLALSFLPVPTFIQNLRDYERSIVFFLEIQFFGAYENGVLWKWGPISSGDVKHKTPTGYYYATEKTENKISNIYNMPMPYSIRFHGPYLFHEQALPGWADSHGCIRMLRRDAKEIFFWMNLGDLVCVV